MIRIRNEKVISINSNTGVSTVEAELIVSSTAELPACDGVANRLLVAGSVAIVPAESKMYMLGFDNTWSEWDNPQQVIITNSGDMYVGSQLVRKKLTQAEYDALTTKDPKVDYCIIEASS